MGRWSKILQLNLKTVCAVTAAVILCLIFAYGRFSISVLSPYSAASGRASLWDDNFKPEGKQRRQRVVSLTPSLTETICALGAEESLVGVTDNDDYPPSVSQLPSVGDMYPNLELIAAAAPDLIVYDERLLPSGVAKRLAKLKGRHLPLRLDSLQDLAEILPVLGQALDKQEEANALSHLLADFIADCRERNRGLKVRPTVFLVIWPNPIMTVGRSSYINTLIDLAGGQNCYANLAAAYPTVSLEDLLRQDPDIIIMNCEGWLDISELPGWSSLQAVQKGRVHYIPSSLLHRPTMRSLQGVKMLRQYCEVDCEG